MVFNVSSGSQAVWQSFSNPTDTLLPTQTMEIEAMLSSRKSETNFSQGRFQFCLQRNGSAVLNPINLPTKYQYDPYYTTGTENAANPSNAGIQVVFDELGYLYVRKRNDERFNLTPHEMVPVTGYYHKATLNFDGVFIISHHPKNSSSNETWTVIKTIPGNICLELNGPLGSGICGFNNVCKLKDDQRLTCECPPGYSLNPPWLSPSNDFAFGFRQISENDDFFLLAIWYYKIPDRTVVWYANGGNPAPRGSKVELTADRGLFRLLRTGSAVLNPINLPTKYPYDQYYTTGTRDAANSSNAGIQVVFDELGYLYVRKRNDERFNLTPHEMVPVTGYYHKATLNFDGVFTISHHPKSSSSNETWTVITTIPSNICLGLNGPRGSGICGFNNVCKLKDDQRPTCECPPGYSLVDPDDKYGSCKPDFLQGCEVDGQRPQEDLYTTVELRNTDWPPSDYELIKPCSQEDCRKSCMQDCFCAAAVSKYDNCWKKKLPLSNGRKDIAVSSVAFLKVSKANSTLQNPLCPPLNAEKNQDSLIVIVSVLLGGSVVVVFVLAGLLCSGPFFYHKKHTEKHQQESFMGMNLRCLTYKELEDATNGFNEELGRGSFGIVYKGVDVYSFGVMLLEIISCRRSVVIETGENDGEILTDWAYDCFRRGTLDALVDDDPEATTTAESYKNITPGLSLTASSNDSWQSPSGEFAFGFQQAYLSLHRATIPGNRHLVNLRSVSRRWQMMASY
ncbi:hypothetical protein NC651_000219 [Populus alba x Populus x berolinensis]|nr:hypothetical protein NC651_000219 [Populus alba x Populus x berolinensis]